MNKTTYLSERIVNIKSLSDIIENCYIMAQLLQNESPHKESFDELIKEIEKARTFEFEIEVRKIGYCE